MRVSRNKIIYSSDKELEKVDLRPDGIDCIPLIFSLGNVGVGGVRPVPGAFSDVRLYDTVLTANEIQDLFQERLENLRGELVVWYPMESIDNTGSVPTTPEASGMMINIIHRIHVHAAERDHRVVFDA